MSTECRGSDDKQRKTWNVLHSEDPNQNRILETEELAASILRFRIHCPQVAGFCRPGQFVIVKQTETSERIPLTIADFSEEDEWIELVVQIVGDSTHKMTGLSQGDRFEDVVGPLGHPSEIKNFGTVVMIGGGLGIAPIHPIQRALKEAGNKIISIIGSRNSDLLFWREAMQQSADELKIVTDDGSAGLKGFVTTALQQLINSGEKIDRVIAIGPAVMMRAVSEVTRTAAIPTIVSLNSIMIDGTGMCGGCRVNIGGQTRFTCVDGPEFDAHQVDFETLMARLATYREMEKNAVKPSLSTPEVLSDYELETWQPEEPNVRLRERIDMPEQNPKIRARNFSEVALGYTPAMAVAEAERCLQCKKPLCVEGCPVNIQIPDFIALIAKGRFGAAAAKIREQNYLPAVTGRVCPQESQCEARCVLERRGKPIAIGRLERFAADWARQNENHEQNKVSIARNEKQIAVIGAGPAGLAAAADLQKSGHAVTIFEALHSPGGVLAYGIPEFRLPKDVVQDECNALADMGVVFKMNMPIGPSVTVPDMLANGFDAVFIGVGAGLPRFAEIPGENLNGVYSSNEFLTRVNLMKAYHPNYDTPVISGKKIAVLGGGNVAMDCARSALRLGAEKVYLVYRRTRAEMPARVEEIHHALEEGIQLMDLTNPIEVLNNGKGWVQGLKCVKTESGEADSSGRRRPSTIAGSEFVLNVDEFIEAIGQTPNPMLTKTWPELELDKRGNIKTDENGMTNIAGVFAGGDIVTGAATVILAMGAGKKAAAAIAAYLKN